MTHDFRRDGMLAHLVRRARTPVRIGFFVAAATLPVAAALAGATQYLYDDLGRLVLAMKDNGASIVYAHDENGNVVSITRSTGIVVASFSPTSGYVGVPITIAGSGFDPDPSDNAVV